MSVWNTLSAGLDLVKGKLDQALGDEEKETKVTERYGLFCVVV